MPQNSRFRNRLNQNDLRVQIHYKKNWSWVKNRQLRPWDDKNSALRTFLDRRSALWKTAKIDKKCRATWPNIVHRSLKRANWKRSRTWITYPVAVLFTTSPFHRGGVQEKTVAFGPGGIYPRGNIKRRCNNLKLPIALPSVLSENFLVGGA